MARKKVLVKDRDTLPEKKLSVGKAFMLEWLDKFGTYEDVEWFDQICKDNVTTFQSNLPGLDETYDTPDWAKVRALFLKKFFPGSYAKKPAGKKQQETFEDKLAKLKARKLLEREQVTLDEPDQEAAAPAPAPKGRKR